MNSDANKKVRGFCVQGLMALISFSVISYGFIRFLLILTTALTSTSLCCVHGTNS